MALQPVHESGEELRFNTGWMNLWGLLFVALLAPFAVLALAIGDAAGRLIGVVLASLCVFLVGWFLRREELTLDLRNRTFVLRKGVWPFLPKTTGAFTEITGLELTTKWVTTDNSPDHRELHVTLLIGTEQAKPVLCESRTYTAGSEQLQHYAKLLRLPAIDPGVFIGPDPPPRPQSFMDDDFDN